jgi:hypothetical protein
MATVGTSPKSDQKIAPVARDHLQPFGKRRDGTTGFDHHIRAASGTECMDLRDRVCGGLVVPDQDRLRTPRRRASASRSGKRSITMTQSTPPRLATAVAARPAGPLPWITTMSNR